MSLPIKPRGTTCEVLTKSGEQCRRPPKIRIQGIDCCAQHHRMIKDGKIVVRGRTMDLPSEVGTSGNRCAVCRGPIRRFNGNSGQYVHTYSAASWAPRPHQVEPMWEEDSK